MEYYRVYYRHVPSARCSFWWLHKGKRDCQPCRLLNMELFCCCHIQMMKKHKQDVQLRDDGKLQGYYRNQWDCFVCKRLDWWYCNVHLLGLRGLPQQQSCFRWKSFLQLLYQRLMRVRKSRTLLGSPCFGRMLYFRSPWVVRIWCWHHNSLCGINTNHFDVLYVVEKTFYKVAANKTCSTCYKNCLAFKIYVVFYHKDPLISPV